MKEGVLVYDSNFWKEFQNVDGTSFLAKARNYAFMLNFDFFQLMKNQKDYSVGVFYLALLNLPRAERFKWVGIVPSLDKEPKDLNQFLEPDIHELQALWKSIRLKSCVSRFCINIPCSGDKYFIWRSCHKKDLQIQRPLSHSWLLSPP